MAEKKRIRLGGQITKSELDEWRENDEWIVERIDTYNDELVLRST